MSNLAIRFHNSLRGRFLLFVILPMLAVFGTLIVLRSLSTFSIVRQEAQTSLQNLANEVAAEVEQGNAQAVLAAQVMASAQQEGMFGLRAESSAFARQVLVDQSAFTGSYFGYEPNADGADAAYVGSAAAELIGAAFDEQGRFIPYWFRNPTNNALLELTPLIDMEMSLYYQGCKELFLKAGRPVAQVTEPYVYEGKMIVEQTYPIVIDGEFKGVAGVDRALSDISSFLKTISANHQVDIFLLSSRSNMIATTLDLGLRTKALRETPYHDLFAPLYGSGGVGRLMVETDPLDQQRYYFNSALIPTGGWLIVMREAEANMIGPIKSELIRTTAAAFLGLLLVAGLIWHFSGSAARRVRAAVETANRIASGDLSEQLDDVAVQQDEIDHMFGSFNRVVESYREVSDVCTAIAGGDFSRRITKRSGQDTLSDAINLMADRRQAAEEGLRQRREQLEVRTQELERLTGESEERATLESNLSALSASLSGNLTVRQAAERGLMAIIAFLTAPMGACFVKRADGRLHRLAAHAYPNRSDLPESFALGAGLVGQTAKSGKAISSEPGADVLPVSFGFGDVAPNRILAYPLIADDVVIGVLEVSLFQSLTPAQERWLEKAGTTLAYALRFTLESEEREQAEERTRLILESTAEGIFGVDTEGAIVFVNAAAGNLLGYSVEEMIGRQSHALIHQRRPDGSDYPAHECPMYAAYNQGQASRIDDECLWRKDGTALPVEYGATPVLDDGKILGAVISFSDTTERRRAEQELKQIVTELEQATAKAEEATEMKSMFLANMSHEIRTPMNAIIGLAYLALKTPLSSKQRDYLNKIHNAGTSLLSIINDILDFSKIEAGKLDIEETHFKIDDVICSVTTLTGQKAHDKGLEFLAEVLHDVPPFLMGDPLRLGQIITNLITNAVKFTEHGEVLLKVESLQVTGDKCELKFTIRDTGLGMSKEQAAKLFQPFTQADMSTTRKHGGTGLGLSISRRLVELMGGQIWLESEPGVGSTFMFTVWLGIGQAKESGRVVPEQLQNLRVLVADDNSAAREIIQEALHDIARQIDTVASGTEVVEAIRQNDATEPYDVVFMDWRMPGMDGLQATRLVRSNETLSKQPAIILVTAFGREEVREEAERLQVDGFLVKPVTRSMLVDTLNTVFSSSADDTVSVSAGAGEGSRLDGMRLLLVEDNEINQQIAVELLEGVGAQIEVANHGREAVDRLFGGPTPAPYDVVLMDLQMPEMDGFQATTKIRSDARFSDLTIVAMTAHATTEERDRCLAAGMNGHVSKPIDPGVLFDTLRRFYRADRAKPRPKPAEPLTPTPETRDEGVTVQGLDAADGLKRVAGNQKLYRKLLKQFLDQQGGAAQEAAALVAAGKRAELKALAHGVKGVAGNLGATAVQRAAGALEKAAGSDDAELSLAPVLQEFTAVIEQFMASLQQAIGTPAAEENPQAQPSERLDPEAVRPVIQQMIGRLNDSDPAAAACLEANEPLFRNLFSVEAFNAFEQALTEFSFDEALASLQKAAADKGCLGD